MASKLDDYLTLISFIRQQTLNLGMEAFWDEWLPAVMLEDPEFGEQIVSAMQDPAFSLEAHQVMPNEEWRIWMLRMGRGAGKTHAASANVNLLAEMLYPGGYGLLVGPTYKHVAETMIDGPSGLIKTARPDFVPHFNKHSGILTWPNGTRCAIYTADNPQGIRGPSLNFAWGDELTLWKNERTFDNLFRAVREKHEHGTRLVITTSPIRAQEWVKAIETRANTVVSTASSMANIHQDATHLAELEAEAQIGSTKAREEILGEWTTGESQLWDQTAIDEMRHETSLTPKAYAETCSRRFLTVDPSGGVHDEFGILLMGKKAKQVVFLGDYSDRLSLTGGFDRVIDMAKAHLKPGDFILFEWNGQRSGGLLLRKMLADAGLSFRVIEVDAQKSKYARAEEAFLHCSMGRVKFVGHSAKLEEQLIQWEPNLKNSPDRGDAFTQGVNHVLGTKQKSRMIQVVNLGHL